MSHRNPKTELQEFCQARGSDRPEYTSVEIKNGWQCSVLVLSSTFTGYGHTKKIAEMVAAEIALKSMRLSSHNYDISKIPPLESKPVEANFNARNSEFEHVASRTIDIREIRQIIILDDESMNTYHPEESFVGKNTTIIYVGENEYNGPFKGKCKIKHRKCSDWIDLMELMRNLICINRPHVILTRCTPSFEF